VEGNQVRVRYGGQAGYGFAGSKGGIRQEGSSSFLKKRTKKLLLLAVSTSFNRAARMLPGTDKSFLVLFFKKELLS
jgi:hypothetical protein